MAMVASGFSPLFQAVHVPQPMPTGPAEQQAFGAEPAREQAEHQRREASG